MREGGKLLELNISLKEKPKHNTASPQYLQNSPAFLKIPIYILC